MLVTKKIIPKNKYKVRTNLGTRVVKDFDEKYLSTIAETTNKMIGNGLRIPAPFDHNKEARPRTDQEIEVNKASSSFNNAGYWKRFWVAPDEKGTPSLYGELDAPGDISDSSSPAYKVTNTNEEVSVSITDNFEDGLGRTWTDGIMHVAIVNHAVVPDQEPFSTIVNMSMVETEGTDTEGLVEELKTVLRKVKVNLPGSTNSNTFLRDLLIAVAQLPESSNDTLEPVPIYMSVGDNEMALTEAQAKALVDTKAVNPATGSPFTMEDLGFQKKDTKPSENKELLASIADKDKQISNYQTLLAAMKNKVVSDTQAFIQKRISNLVASGRVTKEWADANLSPKVEFQMSVVDSKIQDHPLELLLSAMEAMPAKNTPAPTSFQFPNDAAVQDNADATPSVDLSDDEMEKALSALQADGFLN